MTDITELAKSLKAAAEKATPGQWVAFTHADSRTFSVHTPDDKRCGDVIKWAGFDGQRKAKANAEFIALANPANVKRLVEALEKAHSARDEYEAGERSTAVKSVEQQDEIYRLNARIAELESRTVTVKLASRRLPSDYVDGEFGNDDLAAIHNACRLECKVSIEKYLSAYGIVVKWEGE